MEINMNENYHSVIGFVLERGCYPSFAIPYFVDRKGNVCFQVEKDGKIEKDITTIKVVKNLFGKHDYNGVSLMEKNFYKDKIYAFAYSEYDFCVGSKEEVNKFLFKTFKRHQRAIKKAGILDEIIKFSLDDNTAINLKPQKNDDLKTL